MFTGQSLKGPSRTQPPPRPERGRDSIGCCSEALYAPSPEREVLGPWVVSKRGLVVRLVFWVQSQ